MRRGLEILLAILAVAVLVRMATAQDRDSFIQRVKIHEQESVNLNGISFYELQSSKGSTLLSGDKDLELVRFLQEHNGEQVILSLQVVRKLER